MTSDQLNSVLQRHRDDDPPRIDFSVPLDRLMDDAHCQALADDLERVAGDGWEVVKATPDAWRKIPACKGLYMFVWQPAFKVRLASGSPRLASFYWILYVGKAGDGDNQNSLKARYKGEYAKIVGHDPEVLWAEGQPSTRPERLNRLLRVEPLMFWYCVIDDGVEIAGLEKRLYSLFAPPLNASGSKRLRPHGKPKPAF